MSIYFFSSTECQLHEMGEGHPESPARLESIKNALVQNALWQQLTHITPDSASVEQIVLGHDPGYVEYVFSNSPSSGYFPLDPDTLMNAHSLNAAKLAVGAVIQSIDAVFSDSKIQQAFCNTRPPGHHAEFAKAMGFCIFNNIAIAAKYAKQQYQLSRIAIVDFDVHHGNGTEDIVANDDSIMLISSFQWPFYPNSGVPSKANNVHSFPVSAGTCSRSIQQLWKQKILPLLDQYQPQLILVSAGFDAHKDDPLAELDLAGEDYAFFATELKKIARKYSNGRMVASLEGGYNLEALGDSSVHFIQSLIQA